MRGNTRTSKKYPERSSLLDRKWRGTAYGMSLILTWLAVILIAMPTPVLADGMFLPDIPETGYLEVTHHHVTVDIDGFHAVTHVDQGFHNPTDRPIVGHYIFPIPPEAMLSSFSAEVDGERQTFKHRDGESTVTLLNEQIVRHRDPTLLQYAGWASYSFEITVPPHTTRTMTLSYEEVLQPTGGSAHYRYVLSTERYTSQPLAEASVVISLKSASDLGAIYSSSHPITVERSAPNEAHIEWRATDVRPEEDFHLFFTPAADGFGSALLTGTMPDRDDQQQDHLLFLFAPEADTARDVTMDKDLVLILDRSGSMSGEKIVQAKEALHFILDHLNADDRFSIVGFDHRLDVFSRTLKPADGTARREAHDFVDRLTADGNTDLDGALQQGLEILAQSEVRASSTRQVVFLTDGLPTAGVTEPGQIAERAADTNARVEARLHVFGVGYDVNSHLLDRLAVENGGSVTYVQPDENLERRLSEFYRRIANPVLTDLEIRVEGAEVWDLQPEPLPDLFEGSSLLLTGRYRAQGDGPVQIEVRGRTRDELRTYTYTFDLDETGNHLFVPRLWATRRIGALLDEVRVEGERESLIAEIRRLGLTYGIATPYTMDVISGQATGAASAANMALYQDTARLNHASGQTTIQARVQNQAYQQAAYAALAKGGNVEHQGVHNVAQFGNQQVDLTLIQRALQDGTGLEADLEADRTLAFGSEAYFELAQDPAARPILQSGTNVLFEYHGEVIQVVDEENPPAEGWSQDLGDVTQPAHAPTQNQIGPYRHPQANPTRIQQAWTLIQSLLRALLD